MAEFGVSFVPGQGGAGAPSVTGAQTGTPQMPLQQAIQMLAMRLPRMQQSAPAPAPWSLLNSRGGAGMPTGGGGGSLEAIIRALFGGQRAGSPGGGAGQAGQSIGSLPSGLGRPAPSGLLDRLSAASGGYGAPPMDRGLGLGRPAPSGLADRLSGMSGGYGYRPRPQFGGGSSPSYGQRPGSNWQTPPAPPMPRFGFSGMPEPDGPIGGGQNYPGGSSDFDETTGTYRSGRTPGGPAPIPIPSPNPTPIPGPAPPRPEPPVTPLPPVYPTPRPAPPPAPTPAPEPPVTPLPPVMPAPRPPAPLYPGGSSDFDETTGTYRSGRNPGGPAPMPAPPPAPVPMPIWGPPRFDEESYLAANPDVAAAIKNKTWGGSGEEHYNLFGKNEGRAWGGGGRR